MNILEHLSEKVVDRFWAKVNKSENEDDCWIWTAGKDRKGYGSFNFGRVHRQAHRVAYVIANQSNIPDGLFVCHACDVPACVNPKHLWLGTHLDNMKDMVAKGRSARGDNHPRRLCPETVPRGDNHYSRLRPERLARGDNHHSRLHPEKMPRGDNHYLRLCPEKVTRGSAHKNAKLTEDQAREIYRLAKIGEQTHKEIAQQFGVSRPIVSGIVRGEKWRHLGLTQS